MARMRHPDQIGRMAAEGRPYGRISSTTGRYEGLRTAPIKRRAVLIMHGKTASVKVDYGAFCIASDGNEIRKHSKAKGWEFPTRAEIDRFKADITRSAEHDTALADYVRRTPVLR